jgi:hypothetical protein
MYRFLLLALSDNKEDQVSQSLVNSPRYPSLPKRRWVSVAIQVASMSTRLRLRRQPGRSGDGRARCLPERRLGREMSNDQGHLAI